MEPLIKNPTIGADVEFFLQEKATGKIVSAEGHIRGTKEEPFNFDPISKYFSTSLDNVLAEVTIPPVTCKADFWANINKSRRYVDQNIPKGLCTVALPAANLDPHWLMTEQAIKFGCEPDFNAYTGYENNKPECEDPTLRSCGGHIHIGYENSNHELNRRIIRALDLYVGVPSVLQEPDNKRKELYGKAGAFRHKDYGVEYRTISNYYLVSKKLTYWAFDAVQNALDFINSGKELEQYLGGVIQNTINNNNKTTAAEIVRDFKLKIAV